MPARRPLVITDGLVSQLADGDSVSAGVSALQVITASGLSGGGLISSSPSLDVNIAASPSGLIIVGDALASDGTALRTAQTAVTSGNLAASLASSVYSSGIIAQRTALSGATTSASAITVAQGLNPASPVQNFIASGPIIKGAPVGLDDTGRIRILTASGVAVSGAAAVTTFLSENSSRVDAVYIPSLDVHAVSYPNSSVGSPRVVLCKAGVNPNLLVPGSQVIVQSGFTCLDTSIDYSPVSNDLLLAYRPNNLTNSGVAIAAVRLRQSNEIGPFASDRRNLAGYGSGDIQRPSNSYNSYTDSFLITYSDTSVSGLFGFVCNTYKDSNNFNFGPRIRITPEPAVDSKLLPVPNSNNYFLAYSNSDSICKACLVSVAGSGFTVSSPITIGDITTSGFLSTTYIPVVDKYAVNFLNFNNRPSICLASISGELLTVGPINTGLSGSGISASNNFRRATGVSWNAYTNRLLAFYFYQGGGSWCYSCVISGNTTVLETSGYFSPSDISDDISITYDPTRGTTNLFYRENNVLFAPAVSVLKPVVNFTYSPTVSGKPNFIGIARETVSSGSVCSVALPGSQYVSDSPNAYIVGSDYYIYPYGSGLINTTSTVPPNWSGTSPWGSVAKAVSSSGLLVYDLV